MNSLLPTEWKDFKVHYRFHETMYHITVVQVPAGEISQVRVDGAVQQDLAIILADDQVEHSIEWRIPREKVKT